MPPNPPPSVPARGIKRNVTCTEAQMGRSEVDSFYTPPGADLTIQSIVPVDNSIMHDPFIPGLPVTNMNINPDYKSNEDPNVNCVGAPITKFSLKYSSMPWFHGKISRDEAERALHPRTDGLFLIRESTNFPGDYTLCVCFQNKVEHYRIKTHEGKHTIDDEEFFENLEKLIQHYKMDADGLCTQLVKPLYVDDLCVIPENEIEICESIGKGEFGEVMLGKWKKEKVAVKVLKDSSEAEAILMKSLHHENLVNLLGIVRKKDLLYLVTEYMSKGNLVDYLRSRGRLHVTQKDQINFATDTCAGMEYLEKMHVVHRDLAARNVLISENGIAKVSDFGLARVDSYASTESAKLPIKWTAPEALKYNKFSNKSDMWSFGILLWEIYSFGRVPYPRIPLAEVGKHVERGYKMEAPEKCPAEIYEIMKQAWELNPENRPNFHTIKLQLTVLKNQTV